MHEAYVSTTFNDPHPVFIPTGHVHLFQDFTPSTNWPVVSPGLQQRHYSFYKTSSYILDKHVHVQLPAYSFLFFLFFSLQGNYISYQLTLSTLDFAKFSCNIIHVFQYTLQIKRQNPLWLISMDSLYHIAKYLEIGIMILLMAFFHQEKI